MALSAFSCACLCEASAAPQVVRSERFGDGYTYGPEFCVSTTDNITGPDGRALFSSTVKHTDSGDQFSDRTVISYAEDGLSSVATSQTIKQLNFSTSDEEIIEFVWSNSKRSFNFYDQNGNLVRTYGQSWKATQNGGDWDTRYSEGWEYDYDAEGRIDMARYWIQYNPETAPRYTYKLTYDAEGRLAQMLRDGQSNYSPLLCTLTWDKDGKLERIDQKKSSSKDANGEIIWEDDCYFIFTYENGLLANSVKYAYQKGEAVPSVMSYYEFGGNGTYATYGAGIGMSGVSYGVSVTDYETVTTYSVNKISVNQDGTVKWAKPSIRSTNHYADLDTSDSLTATDLTATPGENNGAVEVTCVIPQTDKDVVVTLYRDCEAVFSRPLSEFGDEFDPATRVLRITDHTTVGVHDYTVGLQTKAADGRLVPGRVPQTVSAEVTAALPVPANFRVTGVHKEEKKVTGTDENGQMVTQTVVNTIVSIAWDPISRDDAETYGFKKYEFWNSFYKVAAGYSEYRTNSTYNINFENEEEGDVWIEVDYGMGRVKTEKIHVVVSDYLGSDKKEVWGIANVYNPDTYFTDLSMVKGDLTDTENEPEQIVDLYTKDDMLISEFFGGTNVGEYYYANMSNDDGVNALYSLNFTNGEVVRVGEYAYGADGYCAGNFAYDPTSGILYATYQSYDLEKDDYVNKLLSIDYADGGKATVVATMTNNPYLMTAGDGKIYAALTVGSYPSYSLGIYTLDPATGALTAVPGVETISAGLNSDKAMAYENGKLHITVGTTYMVVDLATGKATNMPSLKKGYCALTFTPSTLTAKAGGQDDPAEEVDTRKLVRRANYGDSMGLFSQNETYESLFYYNAAGNIAREITRSRNAEGNTLLDTWKTDYYTQYDYREDGKISGMRKYQYGLFDLDMIGRNLTASTVYTYDETGKLLNETETCPSTFEGFSDQVTSTDYTHDADGNIATKTVSVNGNVETTVKYTYNDQNKVETAETEAYGMKTVENYSYDETGRLASMSRISPEYGLMGFKTWEYFEGTDILSSEAEYYSFDEAGNPTGGFRTVYEAVDGDTNTLRSFTESLFDGVWNMEAGSEKMSYYTDFDGMAETVATTLDVDAGEGLNSAVLTFTAPQALMVGNGCVINILRDGDSMAMLTVNDIVENNMLDPETMDIRWTDSMVPNGEHEYYIQPMLSQTGEIEPFDLEMNIPEYIGYNISNIADITFDTEIQPVTGFRVKSFEKVYVDAYDHPVSNPMNADHEAYSVTIEWVNPADCEAYGFISHKVYEKPYLTSIATVEDADVNEATFIIQASGIADVYVRSSYKIGYADSEIFPIVLGSIGVNEAAAADSRLRDGVLTLAAPADVQVFDLQGRRLADVRDSSVVDLRSIDGVVIIVISNSDSNKEVLKTTIR